MEPLPRDAITPGSVIVFYDGVCGFCNRAVRFAARRDSADRFRFAPLQGPLARELLMGHEAEAENLDALYVLVDYGLPSERVFSRAEAILRISSEIGGVWALAAVLHVIPSAWLNRAYDSFARRRYALFGKYDSCPLPDERLCSKFVDLPPGQSEKCPEDHERESA